MRRQPKFEAPMWPKDVPKKSEEWTLHLKVITPMFGGGYKSREVDPVNIIRSAAIRGHLRFWWRATAGARYDSLEEMFHAERMLWGGAHVFKSDGTTGSGGYGKVIVRVTNVQPGTLRKCANYVINPNTDNYRAVPQFVRNWPQYALQPFQGKASGRVIEEEPSDARIDVCFTIQIAYPQELGECHKRDIKSSVFAWIRYGGIGARTRRGCGSLALSSYENYDVRIDTKQIQELTVLHGSKYVMGAECTDPILAWQEAVNTYRDFRQKVGFARNQGANMRPGRSRWPEPDSIRRLSGSGPFIHAPNHPVQKGFPRADLGLPIIFHFKDYVETLPPGVPNDPPDTTLEGPRSGLSRFASPVITKAIQVSERKYRPLVIVLTAPHVWHFGNLRLSGGAGAVLAQQDIELLPDDRKQVYPLSQFNGKPIREALLDFVGNQWGSSIGEIQ